MTQCKKYVEMKSTPVKILIESYNEEQSRGSSDIEEREPPSTTEYYW